MIKYVYENIKINLLPDSSSNGRLPQCHYVGVSFRYIIKIIKQQFILLPDKLFIRIVEKGSYF